jgi:dihydrofolate reductase
MRRLHFFNALSADGYFAGTDGEIDWHHVNEETNAFAVEQAQSSGELVFGRITYELMAAFWDTAAALETHPVLARLMTALPKHVFSRTLEAATWENTTLHRGDPASTLAQLKQQPGGDLTILGSANLASSLHDAGVIDEYHLLVNPVLLGDGQPLFQGITQRLPLRLCDTRSFGNGSVLLRYERL